MLLGTPNLPFPCDQVIGGNWIDNPNAFNFPKPSAPPEVLQYLQAIAAGLCGLLQAQSRQGNISCFAYNLFSHNQFRNEAFEAIVSDTYDFATKIQVCNPSLPPEQVLNVAIRKYFVYAVGNCVNRYPDLSQAVDQTQASRAFQGVNNFKSEQQQLDLQYANLQRQTSQGTGILNLGLIPEQSNNNPMLANQGGMIGVAAFSSQTSILQDPDSNDAWSGRRPRKGAASTQPIGQSMNFNVDDLPNTNGVSIGSLGSTVMLDQNNNPAAQQTLVPPRRPRARQQTEVVEQVAAAVATGNPQFDEFVEIPNKVYTEASLEQPVERQQIRSRETEVVEEQPTAEERPQFKIRDMIVPLRLRVLPDSMEEAEDAINAESNRMGVQRELPANIGIMPVGEVGEDGKDPFGVYVSDEGHLVTVVHADDTGWAPSDDQNTRVVYNPFKWHRAFVQRMTADSQVFGPLVEGFIPIEEGDVMDYLDLELDPIERAKALQVLNRDKNYIPLAGEVLEIVQIERHLLQIGTHHQTEKKDQLGVEESENAAKLQKPISAHFEVARRQRKDPSLACVELYNAVNSGKLKHVGGTLPAGTIIRGRSYGGGKRLTAQPSGRPTHYLKEQLIDLMGVQPAMAKRVDRLIAQDINDVVIYGFGYEKVEIDSFVGDYDDLIVLLSDLYRADTIAILKTAIDTRLARWKIEDDGREISVDADALCVVVNCPIEEAGVQLLSVNTAVLTIADWPNLVSMIERATNSPEGDLSNPAIWICGLDGDLWRVHESAFDPQFAVLSRY